MNKVFYTVYSCRANGGSETRVDEEKPEEEGEDSNVHLCERGGGCGDAGGGGIKSLSQTCCLLLTILRLRLLLFICVYYTVCVCMGVCMCV